MMKSDDSKPMDNDRRKHRRLRGVVVEFYSIGEVIPQEMCFTEDISAGGVCILTAKEVPVGTQVSLKIYLPDSKDPIDAKGRVVWTEVSSFLSRDQKKYYDLGIEFVKMDEGSRHRIYEHVLRTIV